MKSSRTELLTLHRMNLKRQRFKTQTSNRLMLNTNGLLAFLSSPSWVPYVSSVSLCCLIHLSLRRYPYTALSKAFFHLTRPLRRPFPILRANSTHFRMWAGTVVLTSWQGENALSSWFVKPLADKDISAALVPLTGKLYVNFDSKVSSVAPCSRNQLIRCSGLFLPFSRFLNWGPCFAAWLPHRKC